MAKQKRGEFNMSLKVLFMVLKKKAGVTSRQVAEELGVSVQTVSQMAGHLDQIKVIELVKLARLLKLETSDLINEILVNSTENWRGKTQ